MVGPLPQLYCIFRSLCNHWVNAKTSSHFSAHNLTIILSRDPATQIELTGLDVAALTFQFYGGKISESLNDSVSHIVLDSTDLTRLPEIRECVKR